MARVYRLTPVQRVVNAGFCLLTRAGRGNPIRHILTVPGRVTGRPRSTPVDIVEVDGQRWLVAPYGVTNWVRNVRSHPEVTLRRGRRHESAIAAPATPAEAVPAIRAYIRAVPVTRRYWEVTADASDADLAIAARRHPVFRLRPAAPER